jgi:hypothetical protein
VNTFELGQNGRYRTNVSQYRRVNTRKAGRMDALAMHPTVKPVQMIADAIRDVSVRGDIVLDLLGSSGSTLIAAEKTGRRARLCELDPVYCDTIIARWEAQARDKAEQLVCGWPRVLAWPLARTTTRRSSAVATRSNMANLPDIRALPRAPRVIPRGARAARRTSRPSCSPACSASCFCAKASAGCRRRRVCGWPV